VSRKALLRKAKHPGTFSCQNCEAAKIAKTRFSMARFDGEVADILNAIGFVFPGVLVEPRAEYEITYYQRLKGPAMAA
jgi:hypothetical protein